MFEFRSQPLQSLYLVYTVVTVICIRLPFWVVVSAIPAWRPRRSWPFLRAVVVRVVNAFVDIMYRTTPHEVHNPEKDAANPDRLGFVWVDAVPEDLIRGDVNEMAQINSVSPVRVSGHWLGRRGPDGKHAQLARYDEKVLYHLHGGGYTRGSGSPKDPTAAIPRSILSHCAGLVDRAFSINYRLSSASPFKPENPFPAALMDALAGYKYLVETVQFNPKNIILSGDSAGGHLAVALARYLVQLDSAFLMIPSALILLSPTVDWGCTHDDKPDSSMNRNANSDFVSIILKSGYSARALLGRLPPDDITTNPWLSPTSLKIASPAGLFTNCPPTCIIAGGAEQTLDAMRTLRDRMVVDTSADNVLYLEYPDAVHDFIVLTIHEPERSQALGDIKEWLSKIFQ